MVHLAAVASEQSGVELMLGILSIFWMLTCVGVMFYGVSNHAVTELGLPHWSSLAVTGLGIAMLMSMFAFGIYAEATDVTWFRSPRQMGGD